jgi:HPt (histidine-containing phosphotransfer) domain-containing protein
MASVTPVVTDAATLEEVMDVLEENVPIQMEGDFQPETLFEILVHAASNAESIEQTCKTLEDTPTSNDVRYHLSKLENLEELEEQLNQALRSRVPGRLQNSRQKLVIDLNLIPYYGTPCEEEEPYIIRSRAKAGTCSFYAYATAYVISSGDRQHSKRSMPAIRDRAGQFYVWEKYARQGALSALRNGKRGRKESKREETLKSEVERLRAVIAELSMENSESFS